MKMYKKILLTIGLLFTPTLAFAVPFNSAQVGTSPVNGYILQTNGNTSTWVPATSGGGSGVGTFSTTSPFGTTQLQYPTVSNTVTSLDINATGTSKWWYNPNNNVQYINASVGIGTTSPTSILPTLPTLDIWGALNVGTSSSSTFIVNPSIPRVDVSAVLSITGSQTPVSLGNPQIYRNNTGDLNILSRSDGTAKDIIFRYGSSFTPSMTIKDGGNIGIGTTSPYAKLSVVGEIVGSNFTATSTTASSTIAKGLNLNQASLSFIKLNAPATAPTVATGAAGVLTGAYTYKVSFVTNTGSTDLSPVSSTVNPVSQKIELTSIPLSTDSRVTGRRIYRTRSSDIYYFLVTTINDNTTTTYSDNNSDSSIEQLGGEARNYQDNSTGGYFYSQGQKAGFLGLYNTTYGVNSGTLIDSGYKNTAYGAESLALSSGGYWQTALGYGALHYLNSTTTKSSGNTAVGGYSLYSNSDGGTNTGVGYRSLYENVTGDASTCVGSRCLTLNLASYNTGVGFNVLASNTTGTENTATGALAAQENVSGSYITALGLNAVRLGTTTSYSTGVGHSALFNAYLNGNTGLGYKAGYTLTYGANNTFLGYLADTSVATINKSTAIGYNAIVASSSSIVLGGTGTDSAYVGINVTTPLTRLHVVDAGAGQAPTATTPNSGLLLTSELSNTSLLLGSDATGATGYSYIQSRSKASQSYLNLVLQQGGGNVGIGTTSPGAKLNVVGTTVSSPLLRVANTDSTDTGMALTNSGSEWQIYNAGSGNNLNFYNSGTKFAITTAGNVGIGTTTPASKVAVTGGSIYSQENVPATSTSMTVDLTTTSNQVLIQLGTSATTITLSHALAGMGSRIITCNPNATAGAITWASSPAGVIQWTNGTVPTQTTTANKCDIWTFTATQASSTSAQSVKIFGAQIPNF